MSLLGDLLNRGFSIRAEEDKLWISPSTDLTPADRERIAAQKPELLGQLQAAHALGKLPPGTEPITLELPTGQRVRILPESESPDRPGLAHMTWEKLRQDGLKELARVEQVFQVAKMFNGRIVHAR